MEAYSLDDSMKYSNLFGCWRLGDISMTTAVTERTNGGRAVLVEQCNCPAEYTGSSCEVCNIRYTGLLGLACFVLRPVVHSLALVAALKILKCCIKLVVSSFIIFYYGSVSVQLTEKMRFQFILGVVICFTNAFQWCKSANINYILGPNIFRYNGYSSS